MGAMCSQSSENPVGFRSPNAEFVYTGQLPVKKREHKPEDDIQENPYTQLETSFDRFEKDWDKQRFYIKNQEEMAAEKKRQIEYAKAAEAAKKAAELQAKLDAEKAEREKKEAAEREEREKKEAAERAIRAAEEARQKAIADEKARELAA